MTSLLWYTIPIALAIALSVFPIVAVLILLLSPNPIARSVPFAVGWPLGLALLVGGFAIGAGLVPQETRDQIPAWTHAAEIVLGVVLVVMSLLLWRRRRGAPASGRLNLSGITSRLGPARAFGFGVVMNIRPKNLILTIAGGLAIGAAPISPADATVTVILFVTVAASTVAGLVIVYAIGRTRVRPMLERLRVFLVAHASGVVTLLVLVIGVVLIVVGTVQLSSL